MSSLIQQYIPILLFKIGKDKTMKHLNLETTNTAEQRIKEYLEQNVSDTLAEKINNGVQVEKDGKTLLNKKTLSGFMRYATDEARKLAEKGSSYACIEDSVVFGWAIHYFEEDSIEGTLYNADGTPYSPPKPQRKATTPKPTPKKEETTPTKPEEDFPTHMLLSF